MQISVSYVASQTHCYPLSNPEGNFPGCQSPSRSASNRAIREKYKSGWLMCHVIHKCLAHNVDQKVDLHCAPPNLKIQLLIILLPSTTRPSFKQKCDQFYSLWFEVTVYQEQNSWLLCYYNWMLSVQLGLRPPEKYSYSQEIRNLWTFQLAAH